jgi:hypothetical protein
MITWAKSVPFSVRMPWAGASAAPLFGLFLYLKWIAPSMVFLKDAQWLALLFAFLAYFGAIFVALQFRKRHIKRPTKIAQ